MAYDDEPTRRIPPQQPRDPYPPAQSRDPYPPGREPPPPAADPAVLEDLFDRVRGLRTALALVGTLAAIATAVALYALLADDGDSGREGASQERVADLEDRVDKLEEQMEERATRGQLSNVRGDIEQLQSQVEELSQQSGDGEEAAQAVDDLQADLQALQERVDELAAGGGGGGGTDEEGTTTTP